MKDQTKTCRYILLGIISLVVVISLITGIYDITHKKKDNNSEKYSKELARLINKKINVKDLREVEYSCSGNMLGNIYNLNLNIDTKRLVLRNSISHNDQTDVFEYIVDDKVISDISKLVKDYNIAAWSSEPMGDEFVYDACYPVIRLVYYDNKTNKYEETYNISFYLDLPKDAEDILYDLKKSLEDITKDNEIFINYQEDV